MHAGRQIRSHQFRMHLPLAFGLALLFLFRLFCVHAHAAPVSQLPIANGIEPGTIALEEFTTDLSEPVAIVHAGDGSSRLFIVEQAGYVRIARDGMVLPTPFLDISSRTISGWETGMLSLAFHPDYVRNGYLYIYYTTFADGFRTEVARYTVSEDPDIVDPSSRQLVYSIKQPGGHHNGGTLAFSPYDGYLYLSTGDGIGDVSVRKTSMDLDSPLGKILRFDVTHGVSLGQPYSIPSDNPFIAQAEALPEIWAIGLRNPWRISFDSANGDLYIGDVGEANREEINYQAVDEPFGQNYGWTCLEGTLPFNTTEPPCTDPAAVARMQLPIAEHERSIARSITGGHVYRGTRYAFLQGRYFYGDFGTGRIWSIAKDGEAWQAPQEEMDTALAITTFGIDEQGEIYVASHNEGTIYRLVDAAGPSVDLSTSTFGSSAPIGINIGETATHTVNLRNSGPASAAMVTATITLPAGMDYVTATLTADAGEFAVIGMDSTRFLQWHGAFADVNRIHIQYQVRANGITTGTLRSVISVTGGNARPFELVQSTYVPLDEMALLHLPLLHSGRSAIVYLPLLQHLSEPAVRTSNNK